MLYQTQRLSEANNRLETLLVQAKDRDHAIYRLSKHFHTTKAEEAQIEGRLTMVPPSNNPMPPGRWRKLTDKIWVKY